MAPAFREYQNAFTFYFAYNNVMVPAESISHALAWLVALLARRQVPYQIVGSLAAQAYGATRPLVDIDLYIPFDQAQSVLEELQPYIVRPAGPHHSDSWDLVYLAMEYEGVYIEIGDSSSDPRFYNQVDQRWEQQIIDFTASKQVHLYGVQLEVMPRDELICYKAMLDREVDHLDIAEMHAPETGNRLSDGKS